MTPAKLLALSEERISSLNLSSLPVDKLAWIYVNKSRDPGEKDKDGRVLREPAPVMPLEEFRTFRRRDQVNTRSESLAAKDDGWDAALLGARASRPEWEQWASKGGKFVKAEK